MRPISHLRRSSVATTLALVAALIPIGAATAGVSLSADVKASIKDKPDPVGEGNDVAYIVKVTNLGPDTATNVELDEFIPPGTTLVSFQSDAGFHCDDGIVTVARGKGADVVCTADSLADGASLSATFIVKTAPLSEGSETITDDIDVFADEDDPNLNNNSKSEDTLVVPRDPDHTDGFIPPEGGTLTTDVGAPGPNAQDTTVLRMRVKGGGPGGNASLDEEDCHAPFAPCIDRIGNFKPPPGYTPDVAPIIAVFLIDGSKDPGVPKKEIQVGFRKHSSDPVVDLPRCGDDPEAPCILQVKRIHPQEWLRIRLLIKSDPKFSPR